MIFVKPRVGSMMTTDRQTFEDIPGTYFFDQARCRQGYHLNMFFMSLLKAENRKSFLEDEPLYLDQYPISAEQRKCVLERDWLGMIRLGGNVYYMSKLGATDQRSFQFLAGSMTGLSQDEYRQMMVLGGRSIDGTRSKKDR